MFPLSDTHRLKGFPFVTIGLIALNVFIFIEQLTSDDPNALISQFALIPKNVSFFNISTLTPFVTSIFLHGGFLHIAANMWFLWIFGDNIELEIGRIRYLLLFIFAGIFGNVMQYLFLSASPIPMIGASGAVSGILGAYAVIFPRNKIKTLLPLLFIFTVVQVPALFYTVYWFVIQLFSGIFSLPFAFQTGGVAFWAHIGGFLTGVWFVRKFPYIKSSNTEIIEGEIVE
ncbi:MAG: rhomboid family intramembrane serine protease [Candidatus Levybacteria bacterium CG_4_10_14_0_2_um_filter_36_16]|nr:MAG: hypothetical protein AUK12_05195 [Candidatus Levybacteria bacterium CG2_30_37_29]PIR78979.1 MAG: rhomboid family intramembrane serine protease [Candidatus Levybacteria bacterium CG10_big_fil_rev_8_21_14_0_10_36_30]PIZ97874.1 MAG: rhomboid family intramembrane serine protease [Candidatus Levybacteria bacterium CG_4_10_14_0_2_um_filter_36_16]